MTAVEAERTRSVSHGYPQLVIMLSDYGNGTGTGSAECQEEVTGGFFLLLV